MKRTKLKDRKLPDYTRHEEIFNMVSHIVGGAFGIVALVTCVIMAALKGNAARVVGAAIYGASMITLYTMSSIYHGLKKERPKKVMQVLDHCTIYFLIAGTYTPITLGPLCDSNTAVGWVVFGIVWGFAALGITFTAIDVNKFLTFSMICYLGMGWCIVFSIKPLLRVLPVMGFVWILLGGVAYTIGAVLYNLGKKMKKRYVHSIFHLFVVAGSILQYFGILFYVVKIR